MGEVLKLKNELRRTDYLGAHIWELALGVTVGIGVWRLPLRTC